VWPERIPTKNPLWQQPVKYASLGNTKTKKPKTNAKSVLLVNFWLTLEASTFTMLQNFHVKHALVLLVSTSVVLMWWCVSKSYVSRHPYDSCLILTGKNTFFRFSAVPLLFFFVSLCLHPFSFLFLSSFAS